MHLPREAAPQALAEFARIVRSGGSLSMSIAEGDGEGFEVATPYGSDRRRWFTRYREPELTALLTATGFSIRNIRRHRAYRDWLSVHATREPAGANGLQRQPRYATGHHQIPRPTTVASAQNDAFGAARTALYPARSHTQIGGSGATAVLGCSVTSRDMRAIAVHPKRAVRPAGRSLPGRAPRHRRCIAIVRRRTWYWCRAFLGQPAPLIGGVCC